jgi:chromate transporter
MNLIDLVVRIFTFNLLTFGNGPVMIPLLQQDLVERRRVLSVDQLLYAFAIARVTPGQANVYVAAIGYMLFGLAGATLSTLAILLPGYAMLPLLRGYERVRGDWAVQNFTRGLTSTSVGLIFAATVQIGRRTLTNPIAWLVFPLTLILTSFLKWNPILSLLVASAVGFVLKRWL